jgi:hypothetical protein
LVSRGEWQTYPEQHEHSPSDVASALAIGLALSARSALTAEEVTKMAIENESLVVAVDAAKGTFSIQTKASKTAFVGGRLSKTGATAQTGAARDKTFGEGRAVQVSYPDGGSDRIALFPKLPFALFRTTLHNKGAAVAEFNHVVSLTADVQLGKAADVKTLGTGGLIAPQQKPGSYAYLAVVDPPTRHGVVGGWLTHDRGSGVVLASAAEDQVRIEAQIDYGKLRLGPGKSEDLETFALGWADDARLGLEAWADAVARVYEIKLRPQPLGYCTWYHARASDAKRLAEQTAFAAKELAPFGFNVIQIDDGWQNGTKREGPAKDFTTHKPTGPYPTGMKAAADDIKKHGLTPGIWFMPFAGDHLDPMFKAHPEWFVKRGDGEPYGTRWGGTCLDMTHPGAREYLRGVVHRIAHDWGYAYFKMDGLWTGTATKQMYVNSGYRDDGIGDAVFHDPNKTNIEAYRDGLKLVRAAAGSDVFFLGCCAPQNMRSFGGAFGLLDAMRIGPDNGPGWTSLMRGPVYGSRNYFLHGRVWYNDPDPVYVRPSVSEEHARLICSWVAVSGQLNLSSEAYPALPAERVDLLKRTIPGHGLLPRPVDLFEHDPPRVWLLTDERRTPRRDIVALYNWDDKPADFDYAMEHIGLAKDTTYAAFDYWSNTLLPPVKGRLRVSVPKQSCRILALRPIVDRPQLLSTSRHVTQGMVDVLEEKWDDAGLILSGKSKVVGADPYELRVVLPAGRPWKVQAADVSEEDKAAGVRVMFKEGDGLARIGVESATNREVGWSIPFHAKDKQD